MKKILLLLITIFFMGTLASCEMSFGTPSGKTEYKITYNTDGGTLPTDAVTKFTDGSLVILPTPTKENCVFLGWFDSDDQLVNDLDGIVKDIVLTAKWDEFIEGKTFTIEYVLNNGVFVEEVQYSYNAGEEYVLPTPRRAGSTFKGWYDYVTDEPVEKITSTTYQDVKVYALWNSVTVVSNINYETNGGVLQEGVKTTYVEGSIQGLPKPTKEGYFFRGWYTSNDYEEVVTTIKATTFGDLNLYAKWVEATMENAYFGILGDSISTYYSSTSQINSIFNGTNQYYYPIYSSTVKNANQTWWYKAVRALNGNLLVNNSYSGGTIIGSGLSAANNSQRLSKFNVGGQTPDIIIIYLGINDAVAKYNTTEFINTYQEVIDKLYRLYNGVQLFICTLPYETYTDGTYRLEYNEAIKKLGTDNEIPVINLENAWTSDTEKKNNWHYLGDNIHPSASGMDVLANLVINEIKDYYGIE